MDILCQAGPLGMGRIVHRMHACFLQSFVRLLEFPLGGFQFFDVPQTKPVGSFIDVDGTYRHKQCAGNRQHRPAERGAWVQDDHHKHRDHC